MRVQLGAAGLGVVEVAPGNEVDPPQAGLGGDGGQHIGLRARRFVVRLLGRGRYWPQVVTHRASG